MVDIQHAAELALALVKQSEGFRSKPYVDPVGKITIGYGTITIDDKPVTMQTAPITEERASELAIQRLSENAEQILKMFAAHRQPSAHDLTTDELAALLDFEYNEGSGNLFSSTLWKLLCEGDLGGVEAQYGRWVWGTERGQKVKLAGLIRRRSNEEKLFEGDESAIV